MIIGNLILAILSTASALGHYSNLAVRNLNFDLAARQNHRRMILETLKKVQRIGNPHRRAIAMEKLQKIVNGLNFLYENQPTEEQTRQEERRNQFAQYHYN